MHRTFYYIQNIFLDFLKSLKNSFYMSCIKELFMCHIAAFLFSVILSAYLFVWLPNFFACLYLSFFNPSLRLLSLFCVCFSSLSPGAGAGSWSWSCELNEYWNCRVTLILADLNLTRLHHAT